jgi:RNA recognition motif-containing protein
MDIVNHFQRYGIIEEIKIMKGKDNKALGYGFLVFLDPESAVRAKELDGTIFLGRTLK